MGWNDKEISHRIMTGIMAKSSSRQTTEAVEVRLHADMDAFFATGGNIEYIPRGVHTINAATNKPFQRPYRLRVIK